MSVSAAKELVAKMVLDDSFRNSIEKAPTEAEKRSLIATAGYHTVSAQDLQEVQGEVQKGLFSDLGGFLGSAVTSLGFDPAGVGSKGAGDIGKTVGGVVDSILPALLL